MPFLARADDRVEDDRERDQQFERGFLELEVRRHERAKAEADRDAAKHEVEDVPAAVGLGEMRREPIGPAIGLFEQVDRRRDIVRLDAAGAIAPPFVADLRLGNAGR